MMKDYIGKTSPKSKLKNKIKSNLINNGKRNKMKDKFLKIKIIDIKN